MPKPTQKKSPSNKTSLKEIVRKMKNTQSSFNQSIKKIKID